MSSIQNLSSFLQALPSFRGKRRVGKFAVTLSGAGKRKDVSIETKAGKFLLPNLIEMISLDLFINGFYEKGLVNFLKDRIPPNGVFVDVGANIGSISIPLSRMRPDINIVAIEASPWIYSFLKENINLNRLSNISAYNFAVFSESGKAMPMYAPKDLFGKGSLKSTFTSDSEMVETITLDDIKMRLKLAAIDFIKVDVEGFEASVFKGMSQIAIADKPKIVFEFSEWAEIAAGFSAREAQSIILSNGYVIQQMDSEFNLVDHPSTLLHESNNANLFAF